jgi:chromosome segregation ATPase
MLASHFHTALRQVLPALFVIALACPPASGRWDGNNTGDALGPYTARRAHAEVIRHALEQRVARFKVQDAQLSASSARMQTQLGTLLEDLESADQPIRKLQADIKRSQILIDDSRRRVDELQNQRLVIEQQIKEKEAMAWLCWILPVYCIAEQLLDKRKALDAQLGDIGGRIDTAERQRDHARTELDRLEKDRRDANTRKADTQRKIAITEQQLTIVHAALAASRSAYHRHCEPLEEFSQQLRLIKEIPPSQRPAAIERHLARIDSQLAKEMVRACQLLSNDGRLSPELLRACALP